MQRWNSLVGIILNFECNEFRTWVWTTPPINKRDERSISLQWFPFLNLPLLTRLLPVVSTNNTAYPQQDNPLASWQAERPHWTDTFNDTCFGHRLVTSDKRQVSTDIGNNNNSAPWTTIDFSSVLPLLTRKESAITTIDNNRFRRSIRFGERHHHQQQEHARNQPITDTDEGRPSSTTIWQRIHCNTNTDAIPTSDFFSALHLSFVHFFPFYYKQKKENATRAIPFISAIPATTDPHRSPTSKMTAHGDCHNNRPPSLHNKQNAYRRREISLHDNHHQHNVDMIRYEQKSKEINTVIVTTTDPHQSPTSKTPTTQVKKSASIPTTHSKKCQFQLTERERETDTDNTDTNRQRHRRDSDKRQQQRPALTPANRCQHFTILQTLVYTFPAPIWSATTTRTNMVTDNIKQAIDILASGNSDNRFRWPILTTTDPHWSTTSQTPATPTTNSDKKFWEKQRDQFGQQAIPTNPDSDNLFRQQQTLIGPQQASIEPAITDCNNDEKNANFANC